MPVEENELTLRALILGGLLAGVMAVANVYLGLKVGMTVSASIPSAVLSMMILRKRAGANALENNIVQTAASAGESLAAGFIFTLPAILLLGSELPYWYCFCCVTLGGAFGVVFSVPLRRMLLPRADLRFPEGVATAEILRSAHEGKTSVKPLLLGGLLSAVFKFTESGLGLVRSSLEMLVGQGVLGLSLSPALLGVGYIVGLNVALVMSVGGFLSWMIAIPFLAEHEVYQSPDILDGLHQVWNSQIRYLGVGAMLVGGAWTLVSLVPAFRGVWRGEQPRECLGVDLSASILRLILLVLSCLLFLGVYLYSDNIFFAVVFGVVFLPCCFFFSSIASYMAGLVGSSNNPVSGICIASVMLSGLLFSGFGSSGALMTVTVGCLVCCASAVGGDNLQDLKAGSILGATPYKQQIMQFLGVLCSALVVPPVLSLLHQTYTVGSRELVAPQATLVAGIVDGIFSNKLPWNLIMMGAVIAVVGIIVDEALKRRGVRFPVLALAVGIYLPITLSMTILLGALSRKFGKGEETLLASGLITGEALMGIGVALLVSTNLTFNLGFIFPEWLMLCYFLTIILLFRNTNHSE